MDPSINTVLGAILGVCLAGPITFHYSKRLIHQSHKNMIEAFKRQDFNKAAAQFRNAFLGEILYLRYNVRIKGTATSNRVGGFLRPAIFKHMEALTRFEPFLSIGERQRMYRAWDEYRHPEGTPQDEDKERDFSFVGYMSIEDTKGTEEAKKIALQKIYEILKFAEQK